MTQRKKQDRFHSSINWISQDHQYRPMTATAADIPELLWMLSAPLAISRVSRLTASYAAGPAVAMCPASGTMPGDMYEGVYGLPAAAYCVIQAAVAAGGAGAVGGPSVS